MSTRDYLSIVPPAADARIRYGSAAEQFGDLRLPPGPGPHPVAVVLHGGWWRREYDLTYAGHAAAALSAAGFASWNVEYRRIGSPDGEFPATLLDVTAALEHVRALAGEYDLDLGRIVATGHSAGGHLAAWLASKHAHRELDRFGSAPPLRGAVPVGGAIDLLRTSELGAGAAAGGELAVHQLLGGSPDEVPERYALASPAELLPAGIPVVAVHGTLDEAVPLEIAVRYVERARAAGDPARLVRLDGVDHFAPFDPSAQAFAAVLAAVREVSGTPER